MKEQVLGVVDPYLLLTKMIVINISQCCVLQVATVVNADSSLSVDKEHLYDFHYM